MIYQQELKERAALYYGCTLEQMDLPIEAWRVLRDNFLNIMGE